jgi:hypothetical protein
MLLACSITAAHAKDPNVVLGFGAVTCVEFVNAEHDPRRKTTLGLDIFAWAQGYFSARNTQQPGAHLTVGGSVSADTLESMLVDQCNELPKTTPVFFAADALYEKLKQKGL